MSKGVALFGSRIEVALLLLALAGLCWTSLGNYLLFHSLVELFAVFVCLGIFVLALNSRNHIENGAVLVLGYAFFAVAILDLLHTLAYKGMGVFPGYDADLPTQLWVAGRMVKAAAFLVAPFFIHRRVPFAPAFGLYAAVLLGLLLVIFPLGIFPHCFVEGQGLTPFKIASEYVVCAVLVFSGLLLRRHVCEFDRGVLRLVLVSLGLSVASELSFTLYQDVYGLLNQVGHYFKLGAFYILYKAVLSQGITRPQELLFRSLTHSREELAESEQALKNAQALALIGSYILDSSGNNCSWSDELYRLLGYKPGEIPCSRESLQRHIHPGDLDRVSEAVGRAFATVGRVDMEFRYVRRDGKVRHGRGLGTVAEDASGERWLSGAIQDITEEIRAREFREEVDRIIRHDLKTPVNGIIGMAQLLSDETDPEEVRKFASMIDESARQLLAAINRSLDIYRMEQGTYQPDLRSVDLLDVARKVLADLGGDMARKSLVGELLLDGRPAGPEDACPVLAEEGLCRTMVANLAQNAVEASPPGQAVRISLRCEADVELAIGNQGAVPVEIRDRFFEKGATFGKKHGTGLGAYSARLMARAMGADISFTTSEQDGTTLQVRFPPAPPAGRS